MQILIVGKSAKEYSLAKKIKEQNPESIIFVAPGNQAIAEFATCVDIQPSSVDELVEFAEANEIGITIACDEVAIKSDITNAFNESGLMIFSPDSEAARIANYKSVGKRFMYKLKIPASKFGIFDRENAAREYVNKAEYPILIKYDEHIDGERVFLCLSAREANKILNKIYATDCPKIVIENYVSGREFSFYVITDGYNAIPIISVVPYKYASEKDGGSVTAGVGAYAPAVFVDAAMERKILDTIVYPTLEEIRKNQEPYVGILGVDLILDENGKLWGVEFNSFFNEPDIDCVLGLLQENLINVFRACSVGSLADDYSEVQLENRFALSLVLTKVTEHLFDAEITPIEGVEDLKEFNEVSVTLYNAVNKQNKVRAKSGRILALSAVAPTLSSAKKIIAENLESVKFKGKKYRKDILEQTDER